jgi:hypothetical protein
VADALVVGGESTKDEFSLAALDELERGLTMEYGER